MRFKKLELNRVRPSAMAVFFGRDQPEKGWSGFTLPLFLKKAEKAFFKKELRCNPSRKMLVN